ncbi:MAG: hypothetical protein M1814_005420 [Vezdaea aestivalis]|nr:MAG: hypothetical protein M1814_005420 [Vezdaea aestivalis]
MNPPPSRPTGARSPLPPRPQAQAHIHRVQRSDSSSSDSSQSSQLTALSKSQQDTALAGFSGQSQHNLSGTLQGSGLQNFSRPTPHASQSDHGIRVRSPGSNQGTPQHAQGFFEPTLPSSNLNPNLANLSASQIAAQAAMHHQAQHARKRSQTIPDATSPTETLNSSNVITGRRKPNISAVGTTQTTTPAHLQVYQHGLPPGSSVAAATTAANVAFPRVSPNAEHFPLEKEAKSKSEKSKMKLFSKPKSIAIIKDKDFTRDRPLGSPSKASFYNQGAIPKMASTSTLSLAESTASGVSTLYQSANSSTATLTPITERATTADKEKQHKPHFLSRQKHKLKDKDDHHHLPLSSAASNSKPLDPSAPQSLYSFVPSSPGPASTTFSKSVSGLDLRHGGRALREKKREEKAIAAGAGSNVNASAGTFDPYAREHDSHLGGSEWGPQGPSHNGLGASTQSLYSTAASQYGDTPVGGFGLSGMTIDDAWPFLKAKLLIIFEGEELRLPVEDCNRLLSFHIQRCIQRRAPHTLLEDFLDLLQAGFSSLDQSLHRIPDDRMIPILVDMWLIVFGQILPYLQAVFLPLDSEFRGTGSLLTAREALDFWSLLPGSEGFRDPPNDVLDVRRMVLIAFRDAVILPRHASLKALFSRLSLESINGGATPSAAMAEGSLLHLSESPDSGSGSAGRPGTAASLDPALASYNSQGSTLLGDTSLGSGVGLAGAAGSRSRAISNVSSNTSSHAETLINLNPYHVPLPMQQMQQAASAKNSARVTEAVGRVLQCMSVLSSVHTGDEAQAMMEGLAKTLKLNWLGRGRTGRNRRGFVGARVVRREGVGVRG